MTQSLASGVTACHQLKIDQDQDAGLLSIPSLSLESLPLLTGDMLHVPNGPRSKGVMGTGIGCCQGLATWCGLVKGGTLRV